MSDSSKHLVFFDGECGFCDHTVNLLLSIDKNKKFIFAPLQGTTAREVLKDLPERYRGEDSLVLVENYNSPEQKFYVLGKGAFRIFWLLGGWWAFIGWISFLPSFLYDWGYRFIARNRKYFFRDSCQLPPQDSKERFLE